MGEEGRKAGKKEGGKKEGREERRGEEGREEEEGRGRHALVGPSCACALSSLLMLLLLGPHHSIVVGAHHRSHSWAVVGHCACACSHAWAFGRHCGRSHLRAVVGCCGHECSWAVGRCVHVCVHGQFVVMCTFAFRGSGWLWWAVDGCFGWSCRLLSAHHVCGWLLVVIGGDHCGRWSLCVIVERWWLGAVVVVRRLSLVVVRRKEAMSHIVTMASCLSVHMRSHVRIMPGISRSCLSPTCSDQQGHFSDQR